MQKSLLLLALFSLSAYSLDARSLSPAEALARVNGTGGHVSRSASVAANPVMSVGTDAAPAMYVFNQSGSGYMIVSADDVAAPLLGYSDSGTFDPQNIPDNLRWWLDEYKAQIEDAIESGAQPYEPVSRASKAAIAPKLTTTWNQSTPYNNLCPTLRGQRTVTGCVATAMAQVMNYHKHPAKASANAKFSYAWETGSQKLTADYSNFAFDWANMLASYSSGYTSAQATAVANLMKACGYSIDMDYNVSSAGGSGAATAAVGGALVDYFSYSPAIRNEPRLLYTAAEWEDMIYNDLNANGPVIYAGNSNLGGHCFVCDGYQNGYFHFDWGWDGMSNGYFLLNALDPDQLGIGGGTGGYNIGQEVVLGVKPASGSETRSPLKFVCGTMLTAAMSGSNINVAGNFTNYSTTTVSGGTLILEIVDASGQVATTLTWSTGDFIPGSYYPSLTIQNAYIRTLTAGTYKVYPKFKTSDGTVYPFQCAPSQAGYVEITKAANGSWSASVPGVDNYSIVDQELKSGFYLNSDFYVSGKTHYTGSIEAEQSIYGVLMSGTDASTVIGVGDEMNVSFIPGSDVAFDYLSYWFLQPDRQAELSVTPGDYYFAFAMEYGSDTSFKLLSTPVKVAVGAELSDMSVDIVNWSVENPTAVDPSNVNVSITAKCSSAAFQGTLTVAVFAINGNDYVNIGEFDTDYVSMTLGQTKTLTAHGAVTASKGQKCLVAVYNGYDQISDAIQITIGEVSGIDDVIADGGKALTASPNPAVDYTVIAASSEISRVDLMSVGGLVTGVPVDIDGTTARVDVSSLSAGLYIARVVTATGVETVKIIKK